MSTLLLASGNSIYNPALNGLIGNTNLSNGINTTQLFLRNFINFAFGAAGIVLFFMLLKGGYQYLTSGADKEAVQKAVKLITTSLVGAAIIFSVYAIVFIMEALFGISLISFTVPVIK